MQMSKRLNNSGMTLLEVLVSILIVGMIVASISYLFTTGLANSFREEKKDAAVQIAREVMEEMKKQLGTASSFFEYRQQMIQLTPLRGASETQQTLLYPSINDAQYSIQIGNKAFEEKKYKLTGTNTKSYTFSLGEFYSLIEIKVMNQALGSTYTLQSYIEKK